MSWFRVGVTFEEYSIIDGIRGHDEVEAIDNALWNWEDAAYIQLVPIKEGN